MHKYVKITYIYTLHLNLYMYTYTNACIYACINIPLCVFVCVSFITQLSLRGLGDSYTQLKHPNNNEHTQLQTLASKNNFQLSEKRNLKQTETRICRGSGAGKP